VTVCPNCQKKTKFKVDHVGGRARKTLEGGHRFQTIWHLICDRCRQPFTDSYPPEEQLLALKDYEVDEGQL